MVTPVKSEGRFAAWFPGTFSLPVRAVEVCHGITLPLKIIEQGGPGSLKTRSGEVNPHAWHREMIGHVPLERPKARGLAEAVNFFDIRAPPPGSEKDSRVGGNEAVEAPCALCIRRTFVFRQVRA